MTYKINPMPAQIAAADLKLLSQVETATLGHWRQFGFLSRQIQPLIPRRRVVGTAVTIAIPGPDSTLLHHLLSLLRPGDFVIVDRLHDDRYACWGGGVTVGAKAAGAVGAVVDGPCTDLEEIEQSDFPMWCRGISPITTRLYDLGGAINVPVSCGNTVVMPGDAVLADESGVIVLPPEEVASEAQKAIDTQTRGKAREASVRTEGVKLGDLSGATAKVLAKLA
ncbi:MAG: RraA family protein [Cereibacter changlensis]|jgi:regulator of RNase E activity RraA|uniref:Putative 4-hydroxy-4-methyl-2-oxoglutarate aldolase n=2 Tax=Cereibacter changlensis TaxID=402884 RepID=A0A2T4JSS0_9RHOB|nr:RraA family protein [Cereibacter changlensis]PTE20958.1 4-hydroxy-4-methyl-2-oxoglutarate aldolase [Cereibacter changlensis JA139]PZX51691.1 regulator of RNase E activity RraA [Cereibacter changlensis]TKA98164.1 RraA family protein [Cereibacter changlensis]